jgi:hypothetical protein
MPRGKERTNCTVGGCDSPGHARGMCVKHYRFYTRTGHLNKRHDYDDGNTPEWHLVRKLFDGFELQPNGCWTCTLAHNVGRGGYAGIQINRESRGRFRDTAHRLSYRHFVGNVPDGLYVCHHCDNPPCWNPDHLFLGTSHDNHIDMVMKLRSTYGAKNANAKLITEDVLEIYRLWDTGTQQKDIAKMFGIHKQYVSLILSGRRWEHLFKQYRASDSI